jgi:hypothetical protein
MNMPRIILALGGLAIFAALRFFVPPPVPTAELEQCGFHIGLTGPCEPGKIAKCEGWPHMDLSGPCESDRTSQGMPPATGQDLARLTIAQPNAP